MSHTPASCCSSTSPIPAAAPQPEATVEALAPRARAAARQLALTTTEVKNTVLRAAADALIAATDQIVAANTIDVDAARADGTSDALIDRLTLTADRIEGIAAGLRAVAALPDPVGEIVGGSTFPNGLKAQQLRVPLGVMGIVYEARPNVTIDAFGLALKSGNAVLLRGSRTAAATNTQLVTIVRGILSQHGLNPDAVALLDCSTHASVMELITARGLVDVVIPRGGAGLINAVVSSATVPTIETGTGNCHVYVDASADIDTAISIVINGKTRRCSVCNATETLLLDQALDPADSRRILQALQDAGVRLHGNIHSLAALGITDVIPARDEDWYDEYLSMDIAVALVAGVDAAIEHIATFSSGHTEAIVARDITVISQFTQRVDSAAVMVNASTAFTDGEQFGMGAEIGISTQKLHARGPMALPELTTTKWIVTGDGHVRP